MFEEHKAFLNFTTTKKRNRFDDIVYNYFHSLLDSTRKISKMMKKFLLSPLRI